MAKKPLARKRRRGRSARQSVRVVPRILYGSTLCAKLAAVRDGKITDAHKVRTILHAAAAITNDALDVTEGDRSLLNEATETFLHGLPRE